MSASKVRPSREPSSFRRHASVNVGGHALCLEASMARTTTRTHRHAMASVARAFSSFGLRASFRLGSWLAPTTTLRRAYRLFSTPMPSVRFQPTGMGSCGAVMSCLAVDRESLAVYTWGNPSAQPYVVLAHGWSSDALLFAPWLQPLRDAGYAVVGFDQVGHGRSSGRSAILQDFVRTLCAVVDHFGPAAALIGHAHGGAATMLALAEGAAADRAILMAPTIDPGAAAQRFARSVGVSRSLSAHLLDEFEMVHQICVSSMHAHIKAPLIGRPALIVHDLDDREVPWTEGEHCARHWSGARLLTTTGLGHHRIVHDASVINAAVRFLHGEEIGQTITSSPNLIHGFA